MRLFTQSRPLTPPSWHLLALCHEPWQKAWNRSVLGNEFLLSCSSRNTWYAQDEQEQALNEDGEEEESVVDDAEDTAEGVVPNSLRFIGIEHLIVR